MNKLSQTLIACGAILAIGCADGATQPRLDVDSYYQLVRVNDIPIEHNEHRCRGVKQILLKVAAENRYGGVIVAYTTTQSAYVADSQPVGRIDSLLFSRRGNQLTVPYLPDSSGGTFTILDRGQRMIGSGFGCHPRRQGVGHDVRTDLEFELLD